MAVTRGSSSKPISSSNTYTSSPKPLAKAKVNVICPMCSDETIDPVDKKKGQQSILCNNPCNKWLYQQCADLSKEAIEAAGSSPDPFYCSHCVIAGQKQEITELKAHLENLTCVISTSNQILPN